MAIIRLEEKVVEFRTDQGIVAAASRFSVAVQFMSQDGVPFTHFAILDSGAPFSVIPYSLWHDRNIPWQILRTQFLRGDHPDPAALTWLTTPCHFGVAALRLLDEETEVRSRLLQVRSKFPLAKVHNPIEQVVILGQNFIADNGITSATRGSSGKLDGVLLAD